ncbi:unknown protein [Oryza sativa Japonica Group]|uniref:Uncharacterized protein n=2 Tax=Oryza sativa TaxID=4530 RepID=Q5NAL5_ORYSJ|nr:hypothetical protein OsI_01174 [Oryza sativa Indica Group]EEE54234.1 hypothetical protein OsJ_01103 [Oryza sativa Japonica Group]BAD81498.1 unknown protein [Oryza sativa Japonica Group]
MAALLGALRGKLHGCALRLRGDSLPVVVSVLAVAALCATALSRTARRWCSPAGWPPSAAATATMSRRSSRRCGWTGWRRACGTATSAGGRGGTT